MISGSSVTARWLAAGDSGNLDEFDRFMHADVVVHAPAGLSTTGRDEEKQVWRDALASLHGLRHEIQEILADGDTEMARVIVTGTIVGDLGSVTTEATGAGRAFTLDQAIICHLRDGLIAEAWEIADIAALLTAPPRD
ncbi:ester cyclase [Microbacterium azadirachtae]|uniref:SnoaL-like polyketide cyclase n=1 Tax=Microbacterium azadirachtae TaxID=582680 RepID=A0A0F0LME4_9MICO|nr:ester cyclase [Microbacterium azadirachtae]KJL34397.1 SnoaL-like polyketide cyclase [Microbacterium azadirachtae]